MKKPRIIIGLILNLLIVAGAAFGAANGYLGFWESVALGWEAFQYFTVDSNLLLGLAALLCIIVDFAMLAGKKPCRFVQALKLMATVGTTITAIIVIAWLYPFQHVGLDVLYSFGFGIWLHAVVPALGIISFLVENQPRMKPWAYAFLGLLPPAIYGGIMIPLVTMGTVPTDYYGFLKFDSANIWINVAWYAGFAVGAYLIGVLLLLLHNIGAKRMNELGAPAEEAPAQVQAEEVPAELPPVSEAPAELPAPEEGAEEPKPEEETKPEEQAEPAPGAEEPKAEPVTVLAPRTAYAHRKLKPQRSVRTYHVTKTANGQWQVKLAKGSKAIKLFPTQREAIAYARGLVESRGGSYRIHSVKGKIRS